MSTKKPHTKSRLGCKQCKKRRIKCDETPPRCENCTKKGLECEYRDWEDVFRSVQFLGPQHAPKQVSRSPSESTSESPPDSNPAPSFTLEDLGLLYHFILYTSLTIEMGGEPAVEIWQHEVPRIAQSHAYLMHAILAVAAVHQMKTNLSNFLTSPQLARQHFSKAIVLFRESVDEVSSDKADVLLSFGILINILTITLDFDRPSEARDPIANWVKFFGMLHESVRMLLPLQDSVQYNAIASRMRYAWNDVQPQALSPELSHSLDQLTQFALLRYSDPVSSFEEAVLVNDTLGQLRDLFTVVSPRPTSWKRILDWPVQLDRNFGLLLERRDPLALCILAHWCVPFYHAPEKWYHQDRPRMLMLAIANELRGSQWAEGIRWPLTETGIGFG